MPDRSDFMEGLKSNRWLVASERWEEILPLETGEIRIQYCKNLRARRYLLRFKRFDLAVCTVPWGGTYPGAKQFVGKHLDWLSRERQRLLERESTKASHCVVGARCWIRGRQEEIRVDPSSGRVFLGNEMLDVPMKDGDLVGAIRTGLQSLANAELRQRIDELMAKHGFAVRSVRLKDQKRRWGSCSSRGAIALNWRLIQVPSSVADYIILHELVHLRVMNHSLKFWAEVERLCPEWRSAEAWIKAHERELFFDV